MTQAAASKLGDGVVSFLNTLNLTQHQVKKANERLDMLSPSC